MKRFIVIAIALLAGAFVLGACASAPKEEPFTVSLDSPRYEAGTAEIYFDRYMSIGGLKKNEFVAVYYYPIEDAVCLSFKLQFAECNQFWDKEGREAFVKAFEQYKDAYEQRSLAKGSKRKTGQAYGFTRGFFAWKKTQLGAQAYGSPKIEFGYFIKDKAAFFETAQLESYYEDPIGRSRNQTSPVIRMYYTRAQAEELITLFNDEYLRGLNSFRSGGSPASAPDAYIEAD